MITLEHDFRVSLPVGETWEVLTDLPTVARCLPGAHLDSEVDGLYEGGISTRIGPISAKYGGSVHFLERDDVGRRAVVAAKGRETKGSGTASAVITLALAPDGDRTRVDVTSELQVSGKAAQFGRSLLAEVSSAMLDTFVRNLEASIADRGTGTAPTPLSGPGAAIDQQPPAESGGEQLDLLRSLVLPLARRCAPSALGAAAGLALGILIGRATSRRD